MGWGLLPGYAREGYGTYSLTINLPHNHQGLSIYFPIINAASRIWINGKWAAPTGLVSEDPKQYSPELTNVLIPLPDKEETIELVIQVANYTHPPPPADSPGSRALTAPPTLSTISPGRTAFRIFSPEV